MQEGAEIEMLQSAKSCRAILLAAVGASLAVVAITSATISKDRPSASTSKNFNGNASVYGDNPGNKTASGEPYDKDSMTAAHRTLPFGTRLKVSHAGRSVVVTVNDRGPFRSDRILDLSNGAASAIGLVGVERVTIEVQ